MKKSLLTLSAVFLVTGCAALKFQTGDVFFEDPALKLNIRELEPTDEEKAGIELKRLAPKSAKLNYRSEDRIFARIQNKRGMRLDFVMQRRENYSAGKRPGTFLMKADTVVDQEGGNLFEEMEISKRNEIVEFKQGFHRSEIGKFKILNWTRTPAFPETKVKVGDSWSYEEKMDIRIESFWIKEMDPTPQVLRAESTLTGFADIGGTRTAVIKTLSRQTKRQNFKLMFKKIQFDIDTEIEDIGYWDYQKGILIASVTRTKSWTQGVNLTLEDYGESQALTYLNRS